MKSGKRVAKIAFILLPLCLVFILLQWQVPEQETDAWRSILFVALIGIYILEGAIFGIFTAIRKVITSKKTMGNRDGS